MRKVVTTTFVTLDGVMQAPGGPEENPTEDFAFGGWVFHFWDEAVDGFNSDITGKPFDLLLGRKTYDVFASFWPDNEDVGIGKAMNAATKYVASRGKPNLTWNDSHQIEGDVVAGIEALKRQDGPDLQLQGSSELVQTLLGAGLIDEMRVLTFPLTVGKGKRLFGDGSVDTKFEVTRTQVSSTGVVMAVYERAGTLGEG